jgi:hypothetical protein
MGSGRDAPECPYLVPVMVDWLWLHSTGVYCRRPHGRTRLPAATRVACVCTTAAHLACPGFLESTDRTATPWRQPVSRSPSPR